MLLWRKEGKRKNWVAKKEKRKTCCWVISDRSFVLSQVFKSSASLVSQWAFPCYIQCNLNTFGRRRRRCGERRKAKCEKPKVIDQQENPWEFQWKARREKESDLFMSPVKLIPFDRHQLSCELWVVSVTFILDGTRVTWATEIKRKEKCETEKEKWI